MSLIGRRTQWGKHCFTYCGPERCDCGASAPPWERAEHELQEKLEIATIRLKESIKQAQTMSFCKICHPFYQFSR